MIGSVISSHFRPHLLKFNLWFGWKQNKKKLTLNFFFHNFEERKSISLHKKLKWHASIWDLFCWKWSRIFWNFWFRVPSRVQILSKVFFCNITILFKAQSNALQKLNYVPQSLSYQPTYIPIRRVSWSWTGSCWSFQCSWVSPKSVLRINLVVNHLKIVRTEVTVIKLWKMKYTAPGCLHCEHLLSPRHRPLASYLGRYVIGE